jgi:hypothetical protein
MCSEPYGKTELSQEVKVLRGWQQFTSCICHWHDQWYRVTLLVPPQTKSGGAYDSHILDETGCAPAPPLGTGRFGRSPKPRTGLSAPTVVASVDLV